MRGLPLRFSWAAVGWSVFASAVLAAAAAVFATSYFSIEDFSAVTVRGYWGGDAGFAIASILATAVVGFYALLITEMVDVDRPILGGVVAGAVTGFFAHPVAWVIWPLLPPDEWSFIAPLFAFYSIFSLVIVGWITVPLGAFAGLVVGVVRVVVPRLASSARR